MCQHHTTPADSSRPVASGPFPWDVGVYDAHCHPTDTMMSISSIASMKARALTVMSTRSQDQDLVSDVATQHGIVDSTSVDSLQGSTDTCIVPSFGWHPWFSYQIYDDTAAQPTYDGTPAGKKAHYDAILSPAPTSKDPGFSDGLPDPIPLSQFLDDTRSRLARHPLALVGEVGLDKAFRIPMAWSEDHEVNRDDTLTPGGREGRLLSPHRVQMAHQCQILQAQLRLAGEMGRAVSAHGVQAHGILYDTISGCWKGHEKEVISKRQRKRIAEGAEDFSSSSGEDSDEEAEEQRPTKTPTSELKKTGPKPYPPRICLHSFSGPANVIKQYMHPAVPAKIFFSFSAAVNWTDGGSDRVKEAIRAVPDNRILVESDLHVAGNEMDLQLERICRVICDIRGWDLRAGVETLARNWREFVQA